jgi:hypothetical protein
MTAEKCPHCGKHPFEYIDVGVGMQKPEVVCCAAAQEAWRHACEVRQVLRMRQASQANTHEWLELVAKKRGPAAAQRLKSDAIALWAQNAKAR